MAYTKQVFQKGDILTADQMNHIENGIEAAHTALMSKVEAVTGKGLSTNDFTDAEKTKLSRIEAMTGANEYRAGKAGLAPTPGQGDHVKFLRGDATWQEMPKAANSDIQGQGYGVIKPGKGLSINSETPGTLDVNVSFDPYSGSSHLNYETYDTYVNNDKNIVAAVNLGTSETYGVVKPGSDMEVLPNGELRAKRYAWSGDAYGTVPPAKSAGFDCFFKGNGIWTDLYSVLAQPYEMDKSYAKGELIRYLDKIYMLDAPLSAGGMATWHEVTLGELIADLIQRVAALENA